MAHTEEYQTVIKLNSDQAQKEIDKLEKKVSDLRKKQADYKPDSVKYKNLQKEIDKTTSKLGAMNNRIKSVEAALKDMSNATPKQLKATIKDINALLNSGDIKRGSREWDSLTVALKQANTELGKIKAETKASQPVLSKFFKFLNDSWGGIFLLFESITRLSATVRSSVDSYASIEEEMASVRKFTGLADEKVRDLNEDLKEMDTRTGRDQLNQLAGSAGRLGKQAKKDIEEFVEGADMINVALGEDLGDGAVEKIGKLTMAFGEDKKKGLKGAMLSTGSAINELVQNSSAQAGFLVDFTARVAGYGKQLGLTQAQIMGFGTVMDENLLRDEMAATAFGNMLTKMQTDTEKFAKIAGMNVKEFTDLLNKDANGAVLALADSLKRADPQTMMKMLDSMGLDGSRAVGVLSTLADKIDDVRKHQERATRAYAEATSVQNEFNIMNNTVQARIDKCKKKFKEMTIELGERLLPVVQYTITGGSMLAKTLSILTSFVYNNWKALAILSAQVGVLTVMWKAHTVWLAIVDARNKAVAASTAALTAAQTLLRSAGVALHAMWAFLTKGVQGYITVMRAARIASLTNPWAALATVLTVVGVAVYGVVKAWGVHKRALLEQDPAWRAAKAHAKDMAEINKRMNSETANQIATINRLTNIIRSNSYSIGERKSAIEKLQQIVLGYHADIKNEGKLIESNTKKLTDYITELKKAARAQAYMDKLAEIENQLLDADLKLSKKRNNLKAVDAELQRGERMGDKNPYKSNKQTFDLSSDQGRGDASVEVEMNGRLVAKLEERKKQEKAINDAEKERNVILKERTFLYNQMQKDGIGIPEQKTVKPEVVSPTTPTVDYVSDEEKKKLDAERHKQEVEERKRLKEAEDAAKAAADANIAAKTHEYAMGKIAYRQYIQDIAQLQQEGLKNRRDVYQEGTAEYEKLNRQLEELSFKGDQKVNQMKLEDLQRCMLRQQAEIEAQAAREEITETEKQVQLRMLNESFLADKVELYKKGSKERLDAEWELEQTEQRNKIEREKEYQQQLDYIRQEYLGMSNEKQLQIALSGLERMHQLGLISEEEYQRAIIAIRARYANAQTPSEHTQGVANDMLTNARNAAAPTESSMPIVGTIQNYKTLMEKLQDMYGKDEKNHEAYLMAKQQATAQFCESLASEIQAAYSSVNQVMQAASSLFSAQQEYETAMVQKKYEKQIAAAGNNQKKVKKLQEKQQKEEAAIKTKYNKKQMVIQMAQAVAQTSINALQAYGAGLAVGGPAAPILAKVFAAMAVAAGMIQIAAIKKQHQAQEAGYYEGGFTGGRSYRRKAGVVHEGEFVANHQAVNNPNILPFLNFLDQAQRNNTVGALTAEDVSRSIGGGSAQVVSPIVNVNVDNERLNGAIDRINDNQDRLASQLEQGIGVDIPIDGENGIYKKIKRYEDLLNNK